MEDIDFENNISISNSIELSEWKCYLFGSNQNGIIFTPTKGNHPNLFWRMMQFICFGNRWVNTKITKP